MLPPQAGKFALVARIDIGARQRWRARRVVDPSGAESHSAARRKGSLVYLTTHHACEGTLGCSGSKCAVLGPRCGPVSAR